MRGGEKQDLRGRCAPRSRPKCASSRRRREYCRGRRAVHQHRLRAVRQPASRWPTSSSSTIQTASRGRTPAAPGATGAAGQPQVPRRAVRAATRWSNKRNTEASRSVRTSSSPARVAQYSPARTLPLAEVKDRRCASASWRSSAAELARKEGEAKLARLAGRRRRRAAAAPRCRVARGRASSPPQIVDGALRADSAKLPAWIGVDLGEQGYAVVRVIKSVPREAPAAEPAQREPRSSRSHLFGGRPGLLQRAQDPLQGRDPGAAAGRNAAGRGALTGVAIFSGYNCSFSAVAVAQLVESQIVIPVVVGSSPISHPNRHL